MSDGSSKGRPAENGFLTPDQWFELRRDFVRQAHAEWQQAIGAAFAWTLGWLRSSARLIAWPPRSVPRKTSVSGPAARTPYSNGTTRRL